MNKIKKEISELWREVSRWDYSYHQKYLKPLSLLGFSVQMLYYFLSITIVGSYESFWFRFTAALLILSASLFPKDRPFKLTEKLYFEFVLFYSLPLMFTYHLVENSGMTYWATAMVICGFSVGMLSQPIIGLFSMLSVFFGSAFFLRASGGYEYDLIIKIEMSMIHCVTMFFVAAATRIAIYRSLDVIIQLRVKKNKLEGLGQMASGICHELNNPLMIVTGNLEIIKMLQNTKKPDNIENTGKSILSASQAAFRMKEIIGNLNIYSEGMVSKNKDLVAPSVVIEDLKRSIGEAINEQQIQLEFYLDETLDNNTRVSRYVYLKIMTNLVLNSVDALKKSEDKFINIFFSKYDKNIKLVVTDNGKGIPLDLQDRIFDPFFTTKNIGEGLGLGLSVIQGIVDNLQGEFYTYTDSNTTSFVVSIPEDQLTS